MNVNSKGNRKSSEFKIFITSTPFLTNGLLVICAVIIFIGRPVVQWAFSGPMQDLYTDLLFCLALIFVMAGGYFAMKRREIPRPGIESVRGFWAVIIGSLGIIAGGIGELFLLYQIFSMLANK
jgi:hypothetical protein